MPFGEHSPAHSRSHLDEGVFELSDELLGLLDDVAGVARLQLAHEDLRVVLSILFVELLLYNIKIFPADFYLLSERLFPLALFFLVFFLDELFQRRAGNWLGSGLLGFFVQPLVRLVH